MSQASRRIKIDCPAVILIAFAGRGGVAWRRRSRMGHVTWDRWVYVLLASVVAACAVTSQEETVSTTRAGVDGTTRQEWKKGDSPWGGVGKLHSTLSWSAHLLRWIASESLRQLHDDYRYARDDLQYRPGRLQRDSNCTRPRIECRALFLQQDTRRRLQ